MICPECKKEVPKPYREFEDFYAKAMMRYNEVIAQRTEILEAFVAKYQCQPDEIEQVEQRTENGLTWYVRFKQK